MTQHFIEKCKECDDIISQCRCHDNNKEIIYTICTNCKLKEFLTKKSSVEEFINKFPSFKDRLHYFEIEGLPDTYPYCSIDDVNEFTIDKQKVKDAILETLKEGLNFYKNDKDLIQCIELFKQVLNIKLGIKQ
jgi:hypothetical protein